MNDSRFVATGPPNGNEAAFEVSSSAQFQVGLKAVGSNVGVAGESEDVNGNASNGTGVLVPLVWLGVSEF
jgi:hypothetical protein